MKSKYSKEYADKVKQLREELVKKIVGSEYKSKLLKKGRTNGHIDFMENLEELLDLYVSARIDISSDTKLSATFEKLLSICDCQNLSELQEIQAEIENEDLTEFQESMIGFNKKIENDIFYKQSHTRAITDFSKMSDEEIQYQEGIDLESRDGVKIYTLNGIPFHMFVHKGEYSGTRGSHGDDQLSVSMISDKIKLNTIGATQVRRLLVFNSIKANDIIEMGTQDLGQDDRRHYDVLKEQKMMIDEFLSNVTNIRGKDYTDYSVHTVYTDEGEIKPEGKLQPDALYIKGEVQPEDIEYAKARGLNIYAYQEEKYQERAITDDKEFEELLSEYAENLDPNLLVPLRNKTPIKSEEFIDKIKNILLENKGSNIRKINVNARTLMNMFNYERRINPELQAQIDSMGELERKPEIELESGSDEEKKFLETRQKEVEQNRMEEKRKIIDRLRQGIVAKDGNGMIQAISELLQTSSNIENDVMQILNFAKNNIEIIRQTECFASIKSLVFEEMEKHFGYEWATPDNNCFQNYRSFSQSYRNSQNQSSNLENIESYFEISEQSTSSKTISAEDLGKEVLVQIKDAQGRKEVREELNAKVQEIEQKQSNDKQEIGD